MNMFKSMIDTINAAPGLIESANTLAAQAQTQAAMNPPPTAPRACPMPTRFRAA